MNNNFDVVVIGGGAAGLCFAVSLAKKNKNLKICVLEALDRVGKKLALTGNGQCNISNKNLSLKNYHGSNVSFAEYALETYGFEYSKAFFESIGIDIVCKDEGRAYPRSFQASSVVDALRFEAETLGVNVITNCRVKEFFKNNNGFKIVTESNNYTSRYLVVATGLLSGGEKVGSFGDGVKMLEKLNFSRVKMTPAIVQLKATNDYLRRLKGIKVECKATLYINGEVSRSEVGEVLFTEYGLSGPAILQLSRNTSRTDEKCEIKLDLIPEYSTEQLTDILIKRRENLRNRPKEQFLITLLQNRLAQTILVSLNTDLNESIAYFTNDEIEKIVKQIKGFNFYVTGNTGFIHSQVTAGGINTKEFNEKTMESKNINGLFALGELLDIDGDCGGFNLAFAFASAFCAAQKIAEETL